MSAPAVSAMNGGAPGLAGRAALVTGATNGIGRELARALAKGGATLFAGCRSISRFERLRDELAASESAETADRLVPAPADLESGAAVEELAQRLIDDEIELDLLFLNAGIHDLPHTLTAEGHEKTYAANYLGHFRLLHRLAAGGALAPRARIVATQSEAVHGNPFARADLGALSNPRSTAGRRLLWRPTASPNTKIFLALAALEYGRRIAGSALEATRFVAASPGPLRTGNVDQPGVTMRLLKLVAPLLLKPASVGAELLLWVATAPGAHAPSGTVFGRDRLPVKLSPRASDRDLARRAWEETERVLGLPPFAPPGAAG